MMLKNSSARRISMNNMLISGGSCLFTNYCAEKERILSLKGKEKLNFVIKFYRCRKCGKVMVLINDTKLPTVCCDEQMEEMIPGATDGAIEKHVPVIHPCGNKVTVTVGDKPHPMTKDHFIMWILLMTDRGIQKKYLCPNDIPSAKFLLLDDESIIGAYAYCNLHYLWKSN